MSKKIHIKHKVIKANVACSSLQPALGRHRLLQPTFPLTFRIRPSFFALPAIHLGNILCQSHLAQEGPSLWLCSKLFLATLQLAKLLLCPEYSLQYTFTALHMLVHHIGGSFTLVLTSSFSKVLCCFHVYMTLSCSILPYCLSVVCLSPCPVGSWTAGLYEVHPQSYITQAKIINEFMWVEQREGLRGGKDISPLRPS